MPTGLGHSHRDCRQRSTPSTTIRCFDGCRRPTASTVLSSNGSRPTWAAGRSMWEQQPLHCCRHLSRMESRCCTLPTCCSWSKFTGCPLTPMQTTLKSTASVSRVRSMPHWQCVCLLRWSVVLDAGQPAAGEPIKDWSALVCFRSTTASDPNFASTYRKYLCAVRDLGVYIDSDVSLWTHVTATVKSRFAALRQIRSVRRCFPQRSANTNPCFGCQQGRLLLLCAGRCLRSSTGQSAVHPQRRRPTRVLSQALRTHHPASPRPSLVAVSCLVFLSCCLLH